MSRGGGAPAQPCKILAAGGKRGLVKLIHPRNNVAYGEFRASRKALSVLRFNHHRENFLFSESFPFFYRITTTINSLYYLTPSPYRCIKHLAFTFSFVAGSYDNKIVMWDIGGVDSNYNFKVVWVFLLESFTCIPEVQTEFSWWVWDFFLPFVFAVSCWCWRLVPHRCTSVSLLLRPAHIYWLPVKTACTASTHNSVPTTPLRGRTIFALALLSFNVTTEYTQYVFLYIIYDD